MADLKKEIKHALVERDMTAHDLAVSLNVSDSYICDIINGKRTPEHMISVIKKKLKIGAADE